MAELIFQIDDSGKLVKLSARPYEREVNLQELLANYPELMPSDIGGVEPRRWLLLSREIAVPDADDSAGRWSLDHLFLDQDAIPTLVEVKRRADGRIRREVVGQMMDYAANAVSYWPLELLMQAFERTHKDADAKLMEFVGHDGGEEVITAFWQQVKTNLQAGRIRMVFLADELPTELRRIIEFMNEQMDPAEVIGVELRQFTGESGRTIIPKLIGQTAAAQQRKSPGGRVQKEWDAESFRDALVQAIGTESLVLIDDLQQWAETRFSYVFWGRGSLSGFFSPIDELQGGRSSKDGYNFQVFALTTNGVVEVMYTWLKNKPPFDDVGRREELHTKLVAIPGIELPADNLTGKPKFPAEVLFDESTRAKFKAVIEWAHDLAAQEAAK